MDYLIKHKKSFKQKMNMCPEMKLLFIKDIAEAIDLYGMPLEKEDIILAIESLITVISGNIDNLELLLSDVSRKDELNHYRMLCSYNLFLSQKLYEYKFPKCKKFIVNNTPNKMFISYDGYLWVC